MPFHLPFQIPRIPDFLKRPLDPTQTLDAFEHYAEKAIDFATRHGGEIGRNIMDDLVDAAGPYAAALDTTVDAFLPGINLYYGEKWAQSRGRRDPFKQKGGVVKPTSSQLPARGMSKRPRDDFPDDREIRRRMGNPTAAYYKVRTSRKKFRKSRKPIVDKGKFVSRNYDDYGTVEKDFTMYVGFQHHGSRGRLYDIIGEAVTKAFLAKLKIYPRSYDEVLFSQDYSRVSLYFKRVKATGVADTETTVTHDIHGVSFKSLAFNVALSIEQQADGSTSVAPTVDSVARYLSRIVMWNDTATDNARMEIADVGDAGRFQFAAQGAVAGFQKNGREGTSGQGQPQRCPSEHFLHPKCQRQPFRRQVGASTVGGPLFRSRRHHGHP